MWLNTKPLEILPTVDAIHVGSLKTLLEKVVQGANVYELCAFGDETIKKISATV